jgi:adenylate cyclase
MKPEFPQRCGVFDVVRWLLNDGCSELSDEHMISELGKKLRLLQLPIDRLGLHLRTLHPQILGRTIAWSPGEPAQIFNREAISTSNALLSRVRQSGEWVVEHADAPLLEWFDAYKGHQLTGFVAVPLVLGQGPAGVAVFATRSPGKFTPEAVEILVDIVPAIRCACEIRLLRQTEKTLLDTYVGRATGQRVLGGSIRRSDVETLQAALFLCDLRDFTALSNQLPPAQMLDRLNLYFDQVVPSVTAMGGEVLKFMGDAVLAFFNLDADPRKSCAAAFEAAHQALSRISSIPYSDAPLRAGVALHYGEVAYGNIGSQERLDFTVIGRDVNLLSRIQTACAATSSPLLMSSQFAALLGERRTRPIGRQLLKGFTESVELLTSDLEPLDPANS